MRNFSNSTPMVSVPRLTRRVCLLIGGALLLITGASCDLSFSTTLPVVTPRPPVIFIAPDNGSVIAEGAPIQIAVDAVDPGGKGVTHVDFSIDGQSVGTQTAANATGQAQMTALQIWTATGVQGHLIQAAAYRADNSVIGTASMTITVVAVTPLPTSTASLTTTLTPLTPTLIPSFTPSVTIVTLAPVLLGTYPTGVPGVTTSPVIGTPNPNGSPTILVLAQSLNVRGGPGTNYPVIGVIPINQSAAIVGRNGDRSWWVVQQNTLRGWVINAPNFIQVNGNISAVPLVAAPPSPTPQPVTPTPLPVFVPTSTP